MRLRVAAWTDKGQRRQENQDYLLYRIRTTEPDAERDCSLFVAADGVGGSAAGAVASRIAAETVAERFPRTGSDDPAAALIEAIRAADHAIAAQAAEEPAMTGMGTTITCAVVRDGQYWMANVGDSRGYLIRDGVARQITLDHSLVAESVREGKLTPEEAAISPYRHVITRSLGGGDGVRADTFGPEPLLPGDLLLLCTDGLTETMTAAEIAEFATADEPGAAVHTLVDEANQRGGPDNISVLLVAVT